MAHFAELDINNKVIRVLTACNQDIANNGGEQSEQAALHFQSLNKFSENGVKWVQTSYNNNFRKRFAGIGDTFDLIKNKFIGRKPFSSWSLDVNDDWQPPIAFPINTTYAPAWDETNLRWISKDNQNNLLIWSPETLSWSTI
jgi:hypothetical protein